MELIIFFSLIGILVGLLIASLIWNIKHSDLKDEFGFQIGQQIIQTRMEINRTQMLKGAIKTLNILRSQYRYLLDDLKQTTHDDAMQCRIMTYEGTYNEIMKYLEITDDEPDKVGYLDWIDKQIKFSECTKSDLMKEYKDVTGMKYDEEPENDEHTKMNN